MSSRNAPPSSWGGALRDDTKNGCVAYYIFKTHNVPNNPFFPRRFEKSGFVTLRLSHRQQFQFFLPQKTFYKQFFSYTQDKFESISPSQLRVFKSAEIESAGGACGELETKPEHHVTSLLFLFLGNKKTHGQKRIM